MSGTGLELGSRTEKENNTGISAAGGSDAPSLNHLNTYSLGINAF